MNNSKKEVMNMTTGSPVKHILVFALPLFIGNVFQQLYNMVDSIIVGNFVGSNALAAVGACGSLTWLFFSLSSGLAIGIGVIVSQSFGAGKEDRIKAAIANSIYILLISSIIFSLTGVIFAEPILRLIDTPSEMLPDAVIYMRTTCSGIVFVSAYAGVSAQLRALGNSKVPLYFLIAASIINTILDIVFVKYLGMKVFGAALATIISQFISAVTCMVYAYRTISYFRISRSDMKADKDIIMQSVKLGAPISLQYAMIAISCVVLQGVVNSFGVTVAAAFTVTSKIESIIQLPYSSISTAVTTYTGQNVGAGKIERVKTGFRYSTHMTFIFSMAMLPLAYLLGSQIIGLFVKDAAVIAMGAVALKITSVCYFPLSTIYIPRGIMNGAGDARFAMINGLTEVSCRIVYACLFTHIPQLGYWGVWVTTGATWTTTGIICLIRYYSGIWQKKAVISSEPSSQNT